MGQTALNLAAGARTRWAAILSGAWMLVILVAFSGLVGQVVMPTLAAVLIFAAVGSLRPAEVATVWRTGPTSQIALATTFCATLFLPIAAAVGIGVALSLLMQLNQEAIDLKVVEIVPERDGTWRERPAPATLTSNEVTVLDVYGSLFYAGSRTLQARLPDPAGAERPAVVLRLRGRTTLGATFFTVVDTYASALAAVDGRLYLSGVDTALAERVRRTRPERLSDPENDAEPASLFKATPVLRESTEAAHRAALAWVANGRSGQSDHS